MEKYLKDEPKRKTNASCGSLASSTSNSPLSSTSSFLDSDMNSSMNTFTNTNTWDLLGCDQNGHHNSSTLDSLFDNVKTEPSDMEEDSTSDSEDRLSLDDLNLWEPSSANLILNNHRNQHCQSRINSSSSNSSSTKISCESISSSNNYNSKSHHAGLNQGDYI